MDENKYKTQKALFLTAVLLFFILIMVGRSSIIPVQTFAVKRHLAIEVESADGFLIEAGAGGLIIEGDDALQEIRVEADIIVDKVTQREFGGILEKSLVLNLERNGDRVALKSQFTKDLYPFKSISQRVDLKVWMPKVLSSIEINDSSGNLVLEGVASKTRINDGSGDISISRHQGLIGINDGSGNIRILHSCGDLEINDGSGDILIKNHEGNIKIKDGSGNIAVSALSGSIEINDRSGDIVLDGVSEDVTIWEEGSGKLKMNNVEGKVNLL